MILLFVGVYGLTEYLRCDATEWLILLSVLAVAVNTQVQWSGLDNAVYSPYKWSSFRTMAGLEIATDWLSVTWILGQFGDDFNASQFKFFEFVHQGLKRPSPWLT